MAQNSIQLEKIDDYRWRIPKSGGMRVDGIVYANETLMKLAQKDQALSQVANVAHLPGITGPSLAMPDLHWGYGFVIGGVAATDPDEDGVVSPGGIGYDINCGVRLLRTDLTQKDMQGRVKDLVEMLFKKIPCGVGSTGSVRLSPQDQRKVLEQGSAWAVRNGFGVADDLDATEENGCLVLADSDQVSDRSLERGKKQLGTLGSGNHFLEIQIVDRILNRSVADVLGLFEDQIVVMIHTGSRGFGYQVCDEHVKTWGKVTQKYGIHLPDRQLVCAPLRSPEGESYVAAMACAANYAWANRQVIMHWTREVFESLFGASWQKLGMHQVYDVAHNIGKFETHMVDGEEKDLFVHRKGATRAFPAGHASVPEKYQQVGQPVMIPGDMGTASYILVGTDTAMEETWGTTCHGAGRVMSRKQAIREHRQQPIKNELENRGIYVRYQGRNTIFEEAPNAYKDVNEVVKVVDAAGISKRVARMRPIGVIKG